MINCDGRVGAVCGACGIYSPCLVHGVLHYNTVHMYANALILPKGAGHPRCFDCLLQDMEPYDIVLSADGSTVHREVWVGAAKHRF